MKRTGFVLASALLVGQATPAIPQSSEVDVALVLAIDCSFSVDTSEFWLQMEGLGAALQSPQVIEAIAKGPNQRIALAVYEWSDVGNQIIIQPWIVIDSAKVAQATGAKLGNAPRAVSEGGTAISSALLYGAAQLASAPPATRKVIDLSTDGRNNMGGPVDVARNAIVGRGITINGLAIANEWPTLDVYLENNIVGGPGNFVIKAKSYDDFGAAMMRKLVKEITGPGMT